MFPSWLRSRLNFILLTLDSASFFTAIKGGGWKYAEFQLSVYLESKKLPGFK